MFSWPRIEHKARTFAGESLRRIAFPLGGIGTGTVSLGGRGNLCDWEVFNRPAKGRHLPYTFFSIWASAAGKQPVARVLERRILPPYDGGFGLPTGRVSGLPRMDEAVFTGAYPIARIEFSDGFLPLRVTLEAFNPMIPMDDKRSGLPVAVFVWTLTNAAHSPVDATVCLSMLNACGLDGTSVPGNRYHPQLGRNVNRLVAGEGFSGIAMETQKYAPDAPGYGTMALATRWPTVTYRTRWERAGWWDDVQNFWDDFAADGLLSDGPEAEPSPDGQSDVGSLGARIHLETGESVEVPFVIAWHFPNLYNCWNQEEAVRGRRLGNWYAVEWPDAWAVAAWTLANLRDLAAATDTFVRAMFDSTLPSEVLDAASANMATIRTATCLRTEDGRFHGFEGCHDNAGCCPMNCTHVWNYEQAVAFLYPSLERTMRETDFLHNMRRDGSMAFRTLLPLQDELWDFKPAADGQMGCILKVYREWLQSGNVAFLEAMWPGVQRALEYAWAPGSWDADQDGVMEGEQHNTYDIEFYGPNTMMGTLYLGALRAAEEIATVLGKLDLAARYRQIFEVGWRKHMDLLWNGSYFEQRVLKPGSDVASSPLKPDSPDYPRYQYGAGCLSDHLLGQWFARVVGLGDLLPRDAVRSAVRAIYEHNFRHDLSTHQSVQRVYAVNDEPGLLLCTWPRGGRPAYPFPYADEVWTGIEYAVAAELIYEGFVEEGLQIVRGVRSRHDGNKRNPWDEPECGHHYARAMSSWSLLLALTGYHYHAAEAHLRVWPADGRYPFRALLTAGTGWGTVDMSSDSGAMRTCLECLWGTIAVQRVEVPLGDPSRLGVLVGDQRAPAHVDRGIVVLDERLFLTPGQQLVIVA